MPFGITFAPINVPLQRRLQTLAVVHYVVIFLMSIGPAIPWLLITALLVFAPILSPLIISYLFWIYVWDRQTAHRGGRRLSFMRRLSLWTYFRDFFPIDLLKTSDLDPSNNYIFCCHPHGIFSIGHFATFGTEGTGFSEKYPGITPHLMTLDVNLKAPLLRDYIMAAGVCASSKESCLHCLNSGPGHSVALVVGGAAESLEARPGSTTLVLKDRRGFVKIALMTGASLVPVYAFGENNLYKQVDNPPGSLLRRVQGRIKKTMGFAPPVFYGRGIFNYTLGLLPHRHPVHVVVGEPIDVKKVENPDDDQVEKIYKQYTEALIQLFNSHKTKYGVSEDTELDFV